MNWTTYLINHFRPEFKLDGHSEIEKIPYNDWIDTKRCIFEWKICSYIFMSVMFTNWTIWESVLYAPQLSPLFSIPLLRNAAFQFEYVRTKYCSLWITYTPYIVHSSLSWNSWRPCKSPLRTSRKIQKSSFLQFISTLSKIKFEFVSNFYSFHEDTSSHSRDSWFFQSLINLCWYRKIHSLYHLKIIVSNWMIHILMFFLLSS